DVSDERERFPADLPGSLSPERGPRTYQLGEIFQITVILQKLHHQVFRKEVVVVAYTYSAEQYPVLGVAQNVPRNALPEEAERRDCSLLLGPDEGTAHLERGPQP